MSMPSEVDRDPHTDLDDLSRRSLLAWTGATAAGAPVQSRGYRDLLGATRSRPDTCSTRSAPSRVTSKRRRVPEA